MDINVLILGKSGAGKSTLLNYLWGSDVAEAGLGRPVTPKAKDGEVGLYKHPPINIKGHNLIVSDSWGLEADKSSEWLDTVMPELVRHEKSPDISDWFHAVIYCVGASSARLEPFETKEVVARLHKAGHTVVFALTKADRASADELEKMRKTISEDCPGNGGIIPVESREVVLRTGSKTITRGKNEIIEAITFGLIKKLRHKLAHQYLGKCRELCAEWKAKTLANYDREAGIFSLTSATLKLVGERSESDFSLMMISLDDWYKTSLFKLHEFHVAFGEAMEFSVASSGVSNDTGFSRSSVEWDLSDHMVNVVVALIPIVNIAYFFTSTGIHREILCEKIDSTVKNVLSKAEEISEKIVKDGE